MAHRSSSTLSPSSSTSSAPNPTSSGPSNTPLSPKSPPNSPPLASNPLPSSNSSKPSSSLLSNSLQSRNLSELNSSSGTLTSVMISVSDSSRTPRFSANRLTLNQYSKAGRRRKPKQQRLQIIPMETKTKD
ncbi:hypothetical protein PGTUg99_015594 [Puccinia graminis f. sp. tritici]|uniref:Uncharacterized protein n=1 Tax=Puccinia graminis f. sp. tritici TaxID=56615 RepID=A0A5B0PAZ0_PUCGR|nr:hypothetical protein PGTUg99_015594 [Puccinia graminis f. sp. tritici]